MVIALLWMAAVAEALLFHCKQRGWCAYVSQVPIPVDVRAPWHYLNRQVSNAVRDIGLTHSLQKPRVHLS